MKTEEHIKTYLEGWRLGEPSLSHSATATGFYYDDPNTGRVFKDGFIAFMEAFKADAAVLCDGDVPVPFLQYTDQVMETSGNVTTVWCWWCVSGTEFQGSAIIKVDDSGVLSERIAYFRP